MRFVGIECDGIRRVHTFREPLPGFSAAGRDLVQTTIDLAGPVAAVGEIHIAVPGECRIVRTRKIAAARAGRINAGSTVGCDPEHRPALGIGDVQIAVGIDRLTKTALLGRTELFTAVVVQVNAINLAAGTGCIGFAVRADGDRFGMVKAANVDDLVFVEQFEHGKLGLCWIRCQVSIADRPATREKRNWTRRSLSFSLQLPSVSSPHRNG